MGYTVFATGLGFTEGPVALEDGSLWLVSIDRGVIYHLDQSGQIIETVEAGGRPQAVAIDKEGVLYVTQAGGGGVEPGIQCVKNGRVAHIVTGMKKPNDLCFGRDGRLYYTDPCETGDINIRSATGPGRIYACDRDGGNLKVAHEGILFPNGLAFNAEGDVLYVAETQTPHRILKLTSSSGGSFDRPTPLGTLDQGVPDGMAVDVEGCVWVAAVRGNSVQVFDRAGNMVRKLDCGEGSKPTNLCFGIGTDRLYVTDAARGGGVLTFDVDVKGISLFG